MSVVRPVPRRGPDSGDKRGLSLSVATMANWMQSSSQQGSSFNGRSRKGAVREGVGSFWQDPWVNQTEAAEQLYEFALQQGIAQVDLPVRLPEANARVPLQGGYNFRDAGGYLASQSRRVRTGVIFRSDHLNELTEADLANLNDLGIRVVHDFRLDSERERQPSRRWNDAEVIELATGDVTGLDITAVELVRDMLAGKRPLPEGNFWGDNYVSMLDAGRPMFVRLLSSLANADRLPALYHCTGGKDRTGIATMLIHKVLGVDDETILDDFLLTNLFRTPFRIQQLSSGLRSVGIDVPKAVPIIGVSREAMVAAIEALDQAHGGAENYLLSGGVGKGELDHLAELLLD
jgi:protein-tyrosine phosphatase